MGSRRLSLNGYVKWVVAHPKRMLLLVGLLTLAPLGFLPRLSFKTTVYDLIIEDLPESARYQEFLELFGSDEIIQLVIRAESIFDPATFAKISALSEACARIPGVRRIISLPEVKKSVDRGGGWDAARFAAMLEPVALFQRNLISADRRSTLITLVLSADADRGAVIAAVHGLMQGAGRDLQLFQTGIPLVSQALADYSQQDFFRLTPVTLLVIAILLTVLFRNACGLVLPMASVCLALVWTFGLMAASGVAVSMLTIIVPVFLIAVGTAYCLHICSEYLVQVRHAGAAGPATLETFRLLALPVILAVCTTVIGIGSLAVNRITAIKEFALFTGLGMFSLLVIVLTFLPAAMALWPPAGARTAAGGTLDRFFARVLARIVLLNQKHQKICLLVLGLVSITCLVGLFRIRVETNPVSFFKQDTPVHRNFTDIHQHLAGCFPINVTLSARSADYFEEPDNVARIAGLQAWLDQLPGVDKTLSFADYLMLVNYVYNQFDPQYYRLPRDPYELRMLMNNFKILLGSDLLQRFMSLDYSRANILMLTHIASSRRFLETRAAVADYARTQLPAEVARQVELDVTGLGVVIAASSQLLTWGQVKSLSLSLVLVFVVMVALFVSSKVGLIAVVPNLFPIMVNFGMMGWLQIPLSAATSLIASVAIGLAVDDTIHYLVRYNTEFKKDLDKDRAMRDTVMSVGRPVIFTSCTIGLGFAVLIFSHFQPTAIFGLLMVVTMLAALVGDLILLPMLMMHVELVTAWDLLKMMPTVGGISPATVHELNQPLNAIKVGNDFLKMMLRQGAVIQPQQLETVTREIGGQVRRASQMIQRLGEMGRLPGFAKEPIQVNGPIGGALALLENQLRLDNIRVRLDLAENLPPVSGHHNRMVQAFYNILDNAREAVETARVQQEDQGDQKEHIIDIRSYEEKGQVRVRIADTGTGIEEHFRERVFEPFFTTKAQGQGKGLGLSISNQIVRDCKGRIVISSTPGQGTAVLVSFPALPA
jgi:predicted RND superfamily exporter protein/nitrogen-specific signal transduction histidine kinase